jgi:hypothetical protein
LFINYLDKGHYFGVDVRRDDLKRGRQELRRLGLDARKPVLVLSDISDACFDIQFDYMLAFSVLIHLTDDILSNALKFVSKHLKGEFYANVNIGSREEGKWAEFPVVWRSLAFYKEQCFKNGLLVSDIGCLDDFANVKASELGKKQRILKIIKGEVCGN